MTDLFPEVLFLSVLGITILRVVTGGVFIAIAIKHFFTKHNSVSDNRAVIASFFEGLIGALFVMGAFTQGAAFVALMYACIASLLLYQKNFLFKNESLYFYVLLAAVAFLIFTTGPGLFALDTPF